MNNRKRTRKLSSMKLILLTLLTGLFLSSCEQNSNRNVSLNEKFIDIYKMDIKMKLADLKELSSKNEMKYKIPYTEALIVQSKFDSIYNLIEENNFYIKPLLVEILKLSRQHYKYKTEKQIQVLVEANITTINKAELQTILLELNGTIIEKIKYDINSCSLRVNRVMVLVAPETKEVKLGDTYEARIIFAADDSTNRPYITYRNQTIKMEAGLGHLQIKTEKKGINKSTGVVNLLSTEDGYLRQFPFKIEFEVK